MIIEYHRPLRLDTAVELLRRKSPPTYPLGGGTWLTGKNDEDFAVVDLQDLLLNAILPTDLVVEAGASVTVQQLSECEDLPAEVRAAAHAESSFNLRQMMTLGGLVAAGDATSILLTVLLCGDVRICLTGVDTPYPLADFLSDRKAILSEKIITTILISRGQYHFEKIARTPASQAELIVAAGRDVDGMLRVSAGGFGLMPVALTGPDFHAALANTCVDAPEYIRAVADTLLTRCLAAIKD